MAGKTIFTDIGATVVIITHDRDLLNNAVNSIVHLEHRKLTFYRGGYDNFERQRAQALELGRQGAGETGSQAPAHDGLCGPLSL